jgi:hypothetical protein
MNGIAQRFNPGLLVQQLALSNDLPPFQTVTSFLFIGKCFWVVGPRLLFGSRVLNACFISGTLVGLCFFLVAAGVEGGAIAVETLGLNLISLHNKT